MTSRVGRMALGGLVCVVACVSKRAPHSPPARTSAAGPGAVLAVSWVNPSPHVVLACGHDLADGKQHVVNGPEPGGPWIGRFAIPSGADRIQCYVGDHAGSAGRWEIFTDRYDCQPGGTLRAQIRLDRTASHELTFAAAFSSEGCSVPRRDRAEQRLVTRTDVPPPMCCFEKVWEFEEGGFLPPTDVRRR
jgi:hypothetical protein